MAKSVVRSQMPKMSPKTSTSTREMRAPFNQSRSGGDGGNGNIPTHTMESLGEKPAKSVAAGFAAPPPAGTHQSRRYPFSGK